LNIPAGHAIYTAVRVLKRLLLILLVLGWAPITAHCKLEILPGLEFLQCISEAQASSGSEGHCNDTECCSVETSLYKAAQPRVAIPAPELSTFSMDSRLTLATPLPGQVHPGILPVPPRDFIEPSWQFLFRTASPPRAPSPVFTSPVS
jgi:hypothetical protein